MRLPSEPTSGTPLALAGIGMPAEAFNKLDIEPLGVLNIHTPRGSLFVDPGLAWKDRDDVLASFSQDFLRDLAGNAFHSGCCAAAMLSILTTYGIAMKRASGSKVHTMRPCSLFKVCSFHSSASDASGIREML